MARSRIPGPLGFQSGSAAAPEDHPGPLGSEGFVMRRDSPGPLGFNDWAGYRALARPKPVQPAAGVCACHRDITLAELRGVFTHRKAQVCEQFLPALNATFKSYKIDTCLRKAHFLAQVGAESGELKYSAEVLPKGKKEADVYDGYKGRGLLQLTYKASYEAYGKAVGHDFTGEHRTDLEKPKWAVDSAAWYWTSHSDEDLNDFADDNDFLAITAHINGGFNGFDDRLEHLKKAFSKLGVRQCPTAKIGKPDYLPFDESAVFDEWLHAFAWGAWNDATTAKTGIAKKNVAARKAGYKRYIDLKAAKMAALTPTKRHHLQAQHHYHYKGDKMDSLAAAGVL